MLKCKPEMVQILPLSETPVLRVTKSPSKFKKSNLEIKNKIILLKLLDTWSSGTLEMSTEPRSRIKSQSRLNQNFTQ